MKDGGVIRFILSAFFIVVLSCIMGGQMAGSGDEQRLGLLFGAILVALAASVILGPRVLWLFYVVPWLVNWIPLPRGGGILQHGGTSWHLVLSPICILMVFFLWALHRVRLTWIRNWVADLLVFLPIFYLVVVFIRHPAGIELFGLGGEMTGGRVVLFAGCGLGWYVFVSVVRIPREKFVRLFRYMFYAWVVGESVCVGLSLLGLYGGRMLQVMDGARDCRFMTLFIVMSVFSLCRYRFWSWKVWVPLCGLVLATLVSGSREFIARDGVMVGTFMLLKKELFPLLLCAALGVGGVYVLAGYGYTEQAPASLQRIFQLMPGVKISKDVAVGTRGSTSDRVEAWKLALDSRTGLIRDRLWGDGYARSAKAVSRHSIYSMRHPELHLTVQTLALSGDWHNGFIETMHRMGLVTVVVVFFFFLYAWISLIRIFYATAGTELQGYAMVVLNFITTQIWFYWFFGETVRFFNAFFYIGFIKILIDYLRSIGQWRPLYSRSIYVPLMLRELPREPILPLQLSRKSVSSKLP